jgi:hypothetical protein
MVMTRVCAIKSCPCLTAADSDYCAAHRAIRAGAKPERQRRRRGTATGDLLADVPADPDLARPTISLLEERLAVLQAPGRISSDGNRQPATEVLPCRHMDRRSCRAESRTVTASRNGPGFRLRPSEQIFVSRSIGNNATGVFADLFLPAQAPVAPTEASPEERFPVLKEALEHPSKKVAKVAIRACKHALQTGHFSRMIGAEYQGLRR